MPLTRSWDEKELLAPVIPTASPRAARRSELLWLIGASLVISAGLALVSQRAQTLELRAGAVKRGTTGKLTHFVSKFRNRFSSII